ncbi:procathepsin L-like [Candoia aspera]|uniref:procathepsin L-like n=1 Tax=Candoia aspera TaxID=51853 RepID=UPI002FD7B596
MLPCLGGALTCLLALRTFSAAQDPALDQDWNDWKSTHVKVYRQGEESFQRDIWERNLRLIREHNREADLGNYTYWLGMNHLGDLTREEFNRKLNGLRPDPAEPWGSNVTWLQESASPEVPKHVDWRPSGYVTPIKDQGNCGSCWAFSATGALEALHFKETRRLVSLSEQNLVDCSWEQGNEGCDGGYMNWAFNYVRDNKGINSEHTYPYKAKDGPCRCDPQDRVVRCAGLVNITKHSERALEQAVARTGPVSVGVDASEFMFYRSGIFFRKGCGKFLNHGMLVVGYSSITGNKKIKKYWILKNSWSKTWGESGYMRLARRAHNHCGVASMASYPFL